MKMLIRRGLLVMALCAGAIAAGCSEEKRSPTGAEDEDGDPGKLRMLLETTSGSGKVYRLRQAVFDVRGFTVPANKTFNGDDNPDSPVIEAFLTQGQYSIVLRDGWFVEQVDKLLGTAIAIPAQLITGSFQQFQIQPNEETLVKFSFLVDGSRVTFGPPGRLILGIGVTETGGDGGTEPPPPPVFQRRSLMENNRQALAPFTIREVFQAAQVNSNLSADPDLLYHEMIDSYASAPNGRLASAVHCGDETTNGQPSLNGYPLRCDRREAQQFDNIGKWFPTAVVNRLDLAPADGANCGQQRIIFANNAQGRMFTIIEGQIPNPHPECGIDACRPIAEFWDSLKNENDAGVRGARLNAAFLTGAPELAAAGFGPFISVQNLSIGTGQVRTNNFDDGQWTLRQFKLMADPLGQSHVIPFPVSEAPHGELWDDNSALPAAANCRQSFLNAVGQLLTDDPAEMAFVVDSECLDAESPNDGFTQAYENHLSNGTGNFRQQLANRLAGTNLSPEEIATRARFAGSCIGCHEEATGSNLGRGVTAPFSNGFVHVDESFTEDCGDGTSCFAASSALKTVFFPRRQRAVDDLLARPLSCGQVELPDGGGVVVPPSGDGGASVPPVDPPPSAVITPDESVPDLVKEDEDARKALEGETTLGGQPAGVNH